LVHSPTVYQKESGKSIGNRFKKQFPFVLKTSFPQLVKILGQVVFNDLLQQLQVLVQGFEQ
jgi:hypothetical protein